MPLYDITFWPTLYRLADCIHMSVSVGFDRGLSAALHLCHAPVEFSPEDDAHCKARLLSLLDEWHIDIKRVYRQRWQRQKKWLREVKTEEAKHFIIQNVWRIVCRLTANRPVSYRSAQRVIADRQTLSTECVWLDASYNVCCRNSTR